MNQIVALRNLYRAQGTLMELHWCPENGSSEDEDSWR